jgi:cell division protein FtsN
MTGAQAASPRAPAAPTRAPVAPAAEPARREAASRFGLEVATFIFEGRAETERQRLATAGQRVRILSTWEYGSRVYRVVIGSYRSTAAAERAADSVLSSGLVLQARVVTLPAAR